MSRVLVISPHPDDEAIGCGGTLCQHRSRGDAIRVVFLTSGEKGGHGRPAAETASVREAEARDAAGILGYGEPEFWRLPDGMVRASRPAVERLGALIDSWRPGLIYVPHAKEMHPDHRAAYRLVLRVTGAREGGPPRAHIRGYEVWTPLSAIDVIVDVSPWVEAKRAAIQAHRSQCDVMRFDEAALGLNRYRGELHSWPGGPYAEVFTEKRA